MRPAWNNLLILPSEKNQNFAQSLIVSDDTVYSDITDNNVRDRIKFIKFVSSFSSNHRINLQKEGINDYRTAVDPIMVQSFHLQIY